MQEKRRERLASAEHPDREDLVAALRALGFRAKEIEPVVREALGLPMPLEEKVRVAIVRLGRRLGRREAPGTCGGPSAITAVATSG